MTSEEYNKFSQQGNELRRTIKETKKELILLIGQKKEGNDDTI